VAGDGAGHARAASTCRIDWARSGVERYARHQKEESETGLAGSPVLDLAGDDKRATWTLRYRRSVRYGARDIVSASEQRLSKGEAGVEAAAARRMVPDRDLYEMYMTRAAVV